MDTSKALKEIGIVAILVLLFDTNSVHSQGAASEQANSVLKKVADIPMPGPAVRFDYQSLDAKNSRLYIAHMNADQLVVFDTENRQVVANLEGFKRIHGVIAVPDANRVFAAATGEHQMVAVEMNSLKILGAAGPIDYPDGLAYSPATNRVFVSDEHGGVDAVVDAKTNKLITSIPLGGGAGNTVYDSGSGHILVAVHGVNELVDIDPAAMKIVGRYKLAGVENPHGIALDATDRLAFIAGEENHSLAVFDLKTMKLISVHRVGDDPDVLAFDPGLGRLYVSAESGTVTVMQKTNRDLRSLGQFHMPHAHTVSVDPKTHLVYFPLENVSGHPLLRIMQPADNNTGAMMKLTGRTILITGGTSGIGLELAKQLISKRNTVLITSRVPQRLAATKSNLPVHTYLCDAANPADIEKLQKAVAADFPHLDVLINNAGIMRNLDLNQPHELTDVTRELAVDLNGPIQMVQVFLPLLKARPDALIVNVSSGLAFVPFPLSPVYSAAKAGVHAYTRALRAQLIRSRIRVVELAPPGTETPLFRDEFEKEMKGQKGMDVKALVKKAISGIESGKTEIRPGLSNVLYILSRIAPRIRFGQMAKMLPVAS